MFTGAGEAGTIRALTFVAVYEVGQAALAKLMHERPSIADEISVTLSRRAKAGALPGSEGQTAAKSSATRLLARIRQVFEVPRE